MQITLPAFGAVIPGQGGRFAAIMRGHIVDGIEQPPYALLVADQVHEFKSAWGEYGKEIKGAGSRTDGATNTAAMLAAIEIDGVRGWFLPALGQLNAAAANVPELFAGDGVYWTSTQDSRNSAFVQAFATVGSAWGGKASEWRVRPFRQIPLDLLNA
jgi:hypothetical protein